VPLPGRWREVLNSDSTIYGGSGIGNMGGVDTAPVPYQGQRYSVMLTLPPLSCLFLAPDRHALSASES
jgi:1,4-alpha-glucan branching enzyme